MMGIDDLTVSCAQIGTMYSHSEGYNCGFRIEFC